MVWGNLLPLSSEQFKIQSNVRMQVQTTGLRGISWNSTHTCQLKRKALTLPMVEQRGSQKVTCLWPLNDVFQSEMHRAGVQLVVCHDGQSILIFSVSDVQNFDFQLVINITPSKSRPLDKDRYKIHFWWGLCVSSARVNGRCTPLSRHWGQSCTRLSSTVHTQDSYSLVRPVRVETGALLTGVLLAFHDVLCTRGAHKPRCTRALVRIPQRLTFRTISTRCGGAVILELAVLPGVARRAGTWVAIQTP